MKQPLQCFNCKGPHLFRRCQEPLDPERKFCFLCGAEGKTKENCENQRCVQIRAEDRAAGRLPPPPRNNRRLPSPPAQELELSLNTDPREADFASLEVAEPANAMPEPNQLANPENSAAQQSSAVEPANSSRLQEAVENFARTFAEIRPDISPEELQVQSFAIQFVGGRPRIVRAEGQKEDLEKPMPPRFD